VSHKSIDLRSRRLVHIDGLWSDAPLKDLFVRSQFRDQRHTSASLISLFRFSWA
jgi:hypothetical protein